MRGKVKSILPRNMATFERKNKNRWDDGEEGNLLKIKKCVATMVEAGGRENEEEGKFDVITNTIWNLANMNWK